MLLPCQQCSFLYSSCLCLCESKYECPRRVASAIVFGNFQPMRLQSLNSLPLGSIRKINEEKSWRVSSSLHLASILQQPGAFQCLSSGERSPNLFWQVRFLSDKLFTNYLIRSVAAGQSVGFQRIQMVQRRAIKPYIPVSFLGTSLINDVAEQIAAIVFLLPGSLFPTVVHFPPSSKSASL